MNKITQRNRIMIQHGPLAMQKRRKNNLDSFLSFCTFIATNELFLAATQLACHSITYRCIHSDGIICSIEQTNNKDTLDKIIRIRLHSTVWIAATGRQFEWNTAPDARMCVHSYRIWQSAFQE